MRGQIDDHWENWFLPVFMVSREPIEAAKAEKIAAAAAAVAVVNVFT